MMKKQIISANEPYFVHIGYTYANELKKAKRYRTGKYPYIKVKMRSCVQKRLNKLHEYWRRAVL